MSQKLPSVLVIRSALPVLLPVALWGLLFVSLGAGQASDILNPSNARSFVHGIRAVLPFVVAGSVAVFIVARILQGYMPSGSVLGPLGLTSLYGLIGFLAAFNSPDRSVAYWWAGLYLSVPIVLWGIVWGSNPLRQIRLLVNVTWLAVILAAVVLLAIAIFKLDFIDRLVDPELLLKCRSANWLDLTSGKIRGTGVGRYAAITALIAISGMWIPKWRPVWSVVLLVSLVFLLYTAARGSFVGFGAGAALILVVYTVSSGRRAVVTGLAAIAIALPILWGTGLTDKFLENCFFRSQAPSVPQQTTDQSAQVSADLTAPETTKDLVRVTTSVTPAITVIPVVPDSEKPIKIAKSKPAVESILKETKPVVSEVTSEPVADVVSESSEQPVVAAARAKPEDISIPEVTTPVAPGSEKPVQTAKSKPAVESIPKETKPVASEVTNEPVADAVSEPSDQPVVAAARAKPEVELIPEEFYTFSGRQAVWSDGWRLFIDSPLWGYGFHADRLLLDTHMHNSVMHALLQTGLLGTIPFIMAIVIAWIFLLRIFLNIKSLPAPDKHLVIQCSGILAFFTMRSFPESTGAFFGVDWLIIAVILFYLQMVTARNVPLRSALT